MTDQERREITVTAQQATAAGFASVHERIDDLARKIATLEMKVTKLESKPR